MNELQFRALVGEMLDAQHTYFKKGRKQSDLQKSIELERRVRAELAAGPDQAESLSEEQVKAQLSLFDEAEPVEAKK